MTLNKIIDMDLLNDNTHVIFRDNDFHVLAHGNWYQDNVLDYLDSEIESFTWQNDNEFYIDLSITG